MLKPNNQINVSGTQQPLSPEQIKANAEKWGVHSCQHSDFEHICSCDVKQDHPALNP